MKKVIETAQVLSKKAFLSNVVIGNYRITIIITEYNNGWKRKEVLLPEGVTMSGNCSANSLYKKKEPFTKIQYNLFGQTHTCIVYAETVNAGYIF